MKPEFKRLKDLTDKSSKYRTKIKVIHKGSAQEPKDKVRYQRLMLQDDQGFRMKAIIFGNDIESFSESLQRNGEYELSNAIVKPVDAKYAVRSNEYSLIINGQTNIEPLTSDPSLLGPQYRTLFSVPKDTRSDLLYDVIGVILFVSETRIVPRVKEGDSKAKQGESKNKEGEDKVREGEDRVAEVKIFDFSCDHPITVSLWNEIAHAQEEVLSLWKTTLPVVGFTALRTKTFKGFTLSSTMSTTLILDPDGPKGKTMYNWRCENEDLLSSHRAKLVRLHDRSQQPPLITISELKEKKAHETWQEERFYLYVSMPYVSVEKMRVYLGCSICGKRSTMGEAANFYCINCGDAKAECVPRASISAELVDSTGKYNFSFFNKDVETIAQLSCEQLWNLKDDAGAMAEKIEEIQKLVMRVEVVPTYALTISRTLIWTVRTVRLE